MKLPISFVLFGQLFGCKNCQENNLVKQDKIDQETDDTTEDNTDDTQDTEEPAFANNWGSWLGMATQPSGAIGVSYYDKTAGAIGYAEKDLSASNPIWKHEEVDGYTNEQGLDEGDRGKYTSLAIATDGRPWIAYYDVSLRFLRYATREPGGGEWTVAMADTGGGPSPDAGLYTDIALDAEENPVIVHYDLNSTDLRIAHWDGSAFTGEVIDEGTDATDENGEVVENNAGKFPSIAIADGVEYIAYYDAAHGDLKLAIGSSGNYNIETVDSEGDVGQWTDIVVYNETIHITYQDVGNQDLKYVTGTAGSWTITTVDSGDMVGADSALSLHGGFPTIVYFDGQNNDMKLARITGTEWAIETIIGNDGALGFHNEIVNVDGRHYAACYNYTVGTLWLDSVD